MALSSEQVSKLLGLVASTQDDNRDCDGCFEQLAEFAETQLAGREVPEALQAIERHLQQCPCCKDEFDALMIGLESVQDDA